MATRHAPVGLGRIVRRAHGPARHWPSDLVARDERPVPARVAHRIAETADKRRILDTESGSRGGSEMDTTAISRRDYVRAVVTAAQHTGESATPWSALGDLRDHFADEGDLLVELHREWLRILVGQLHHGGLVSQRTPIHVRDVYRRTC